MQNMTCKHFMLFEMQTGRTAKRSLGRSVQIQSVSLGGRLQGGKITACGEKETIWDSVVPEALCPTHSPAHASSLAAAAIKLDKARQNQAAISFLLFTGTLAHPAVARGR